jgi:hypothetical protein
MSLDAAERTTTPTSVSGARLYHVALFGPARAGYLQAQDLEA